MKRYILFFLLPLLMTVGCSREKDSFQVVGEPYFSVAVWDGGKVPLAELDEMSAQYSLKLGANGYSAAENKEGHVSSAPRFHIKSNLRWKILPVSGEPADWIHPFPESGEKEGIFFFKTDRNINPVDGREMMYNILVDNGSGNYEPLEGILRVSQTESPHFLEESAAKFNVTASSQNVRLRIYSNVDWTYELSPMEDYATENLEWITDNTQHTAGKQIDTLVLRVAANEGGIRGANITIRYSLDGEDHADVIPLTQYPAVETNLEGFPVTWAVRVADNTFATSFPSSGTIAPVTGSGMITFNSDCGKAADVNGKVVWDVSDNSPRVAGVWPGDYCEFAAYAPVSKGSIVKIVFATRVSGTGQKYWRLEYRDGETWKIVGLPLSDDSVMGPDGKPVVYTHTMAADGSTNIKVENIVIYENNTDQVEFRFICAANYQANGSGPLAAPNGGTWRLSVDAASADDAYQPSISIVAAGSEILTPANMSVAPAFLAFEGKGGAKKQFTVTCDQSFTLTPEQSWIHVNTLESDGGENLPFTVTCDDSALEKNREGKITIKAGITRREIAIVQGAGAGSGSDGELEPFIAVVSANAIEVPYTAGTATIRVQTNTDVTPKALAPWLSVSAAPSTKAGEVGIKEFIVSYAENPSTTEGRSGQVTFSNAGQKLEAALTVTQAVNIASKTIYFSDDFEWLQPYVDAYLEATPADKGKMDPVGSNLASHAQPNVWGKFADTMGKVITGKGYVDLEHAAGLGNNTLYVQQNYFKMGAGNKQTGLQLPPVDFGTTPIDVELRFDWCAHMSGSGNIDVVNLVVELVDGGTCADTDKAVSGTFATAQVTGQLAWQHASIVLKGVTSATRIQIKPNYPGFKESGNHRWHLDNIVILEK